MEILPNVGVDGAQGVSETVVKKKTEKNSAKSFESALKELEIIVQKMEQEDLPLEEALVYFEAGIRLSSDCQKILKTAEQKIEMVQSSLENAGSGNKK
jgi:exodeoxyribonuclease VII small subunit